MRVEVHAADAGGCGYYRLIWPAYAVESAGLAEVEVRIPGTDAPPFLPGLFSEPAHEYVGLGRREWPDVLVLQRPLRYPLQEMIPHLQAQGVAVVVELDDDFEQVSRRNYVWSPKLDAAAKILHECCDRADLVTVSTPALAERYGQVTPAVVIPNYVPAFYLGVERQDRDDDEVRVGWTGSVGVHPDDLQVVGNGVATALRGRDDTRVAVVGPDTRVAKGLGVGRVHHATGWLPLDRYPHEVARLDVGLAPLEHSAFNEAKSWLKPLEYAALGVPCVATPTREYRALFDQYPGAIHALADHPAQWRDAVRELLDPEIRSATGALARAAVASMTIENHRDDWAAAWTAARAYHQKGKS